MLHHPPKLTYNGLTIILSNPSRFDHTTLLSGIAGNFFNYECLQPHFNRYQCDIRTRFLKEPLLANTKVVLLLGETAFHQYFPDMKDNRLGEIRGSVYERNGILFIASFSPQDCMDMQDYEKMLNPFLKFNKNPDQVSSEMLAELDKDSSDPSVDKRRHGVTSRENFRFWLKADVRKAIRILKNNGQIPSTYENPNYIVYPNSGDVIKSLLSTKSEYLDFDIETANLDNTITCIAFSFGDDRNIYVVPFYRHDYSLAYEPLALAKILRAFAIALRDNIAVAHNGAGFDYLVLAQRYGLAVNRVFDTMIAWHRCYPEIEKSLGHLTSFCTYEPFHKDEINTAFGTREQATKLWNYCGKDVWTMKLIRKHIQDYAKTIPGLEQSIQQAMDSIVPYMVTSLFGISYNQNKVAEIMSENDRLMNQYLRIIRLLSGRKVLLPTSNKDCVEYFHQQLNYPVVKKSKKTGKPSLGEEAMYKLRLKYNNPVIDFCLAYRQISTESGFLKFIPLSID